MVNLGTATVASAEVLGGGEALLTRVAAEASVPGVTRLRFAPGYLYVPGLMPVWEALERSAASDIHFLIGNTAGMLTDEQRVATAQQFGYEGLTKEMDLAALAPDLDVAAAARRERQRVVAETATALRENLLRLPLDLPEHERFLLSLARSVGTNRVRIRIYAEGRLHAKAALFETSDSGARLALVGSSNLTLPTSGNPTEMNVALRDPAAVQEVAGWFDTLWAAAHDFTRPFFTELSQYLVSGGDAL